MQSGPSAVTYAAEGRTPWYVAFPIAASEVVSHLFMTLAVVSAVAIATATLLLLLAIAAPLGVALLAWILWRWAHAGRGVASGACPAVRRVPGAQTDATGDEELAPERPLPSW